MKSLRKMDQFYRKLLLKGGIKKNLKPAFFIIGAQKSGTTSLFRYINRYASNFISPLKKEIHYYDYNYYKDINWYYSHYPLKISDDQESMTGEASPYYLFHPATPERISKDFPNTRFVVLLRNPIDRAFSQYNFQKKNRIGPHEPFSFEEAIEIEEERLTGEIEKLLSSNTYRGERYQYYSYLARGRYVEQLKRWYKYFDRDQFLIIQSELFFSNTEEKLMKIFNWLGLRRNKRKFCFKKNNTTNYDKLSGETRDKLYDYFEPYNDSLFDLIGDRFNWR